MIITVPAITGILLLLSGALILGITIYFFIESTRRLSKTLNESKQKLGLSPKKPYWNKVHSVSDSLTGLPLLKTNIENGSSAVPVQKKEEYGQEYADFDASSIFSLKDAVLQQQETLKSLLNKINELEEATGNKMQNIKKNAELEEQIEKLEMELEAKENELNKQKQQDGLAHQMTVKIDEVHKEFEVLQQKLISMEDQAGRTNLLLIELEDTKQACEQLHKDLIRKQEKLEQTISENQRLHKALNETEDKLAEANLHRQQLMKKVQFLQDMNNELQHISDANYKLKNELRRIGELESMLSIIAEERDRLLKR
jgi:chromosome segregation ATPase